MTPSQTKRMEELSREYSLGGGPDLCHFVDFKAGYEAATREAEKLVEALVWCNEFMTARDEMNSKVHCAPVRLSPLTERIKQALAACLGEKEWEW